MSRPSPTSTLFPYTTLFRSELLPRVFEIFVQGDRSIARTEGGLGIGLTLVQKLAEMHDGSVTAKSEGVGRSEEHTSELQSPCNLVCRLLLEKKNRTHSRLLS